jgi:hypothetical protein
LILKNPPCEFDYDFALIEIVTDTCKQFFNLIEQRGQKAHAHICFGDGLKRETLECELKSLRVRYAGIYVFESEDDPAKNIIQILNFIHCLDSLDLFKVILIYETDIIGYNLIDDLIRKELNHHLLLGFYNDSSNFEDIIIPNQILPITFSFNSTLPECIKDLFHVDFFDITQSTKLAFYFIPIQAKSFQFLPEIIFPNSLDHLDFGVLRINQSKIILCLLENPGKYPITFSFGFRIPVYIHKLKTSPGQGTIPNGGPIDVAFSFKSKELDFVNFENFFMKLFI